MGFIPAVRTSLILVIYGGKYAGLQMRHYFQVIHFYTQARYLATVAGPQKRRHAPEVPRKESISKVPTETFLKAFAKEHPALHGITTTPDHHAADFKNLGLRSDLCDALETMNIDQPTTVQVQSIPRILKGHNLLCASQTGSGKTLAYLLPIINLLKNQEEIEGILSRSSRPRACIVVPYRELAVQILDIVKYLSHFTKLRSLGLISGRKKKWIREGLYEPVDIMVCTPHVLLRYLQKGDVFLSDLSHLVVDEADTMFDASFVSIAVDILKYAGVRSWSETQHRVQTTFVTTTVPQELLKTLDHMIPNLSICNSDLHQVLPHVSQKFVKISQHKKSELLLDIVSRELKQKDKQLMVFCNTTKSCDWTSYFLEKQGIPQIRLNGNMHKKERRLHLKSFKEEEVPVLVCTDVASRGLDTTNVCHVINFDFPVNVVDYMHRAGRTGRLGTTLGTSSPRVTSFVSHNRELVIMEKIKKAMQQNSPLEDATLWQTERPTKRQWQKKNLIG